MGRGRTVNKGLPPRMTIKGGTYWHVTSGAPRRWRKLSREYPLALRLYADIEGTQYPEHDVTFRAIVSRYRREILPTKAFATQRMNEAELINLLKVFAEVPIDTIRPHHVRQYLDRRGLKAPIRANREKALLSHVFNCAREWGYTDKANPCAGVKGHREIGRDRYISDDEYRTLWERADATLQDAIDIAYYTAQRPADVLRMQCADIRDGALWITQGKTGQKLRIRITGKLADVIERILARPTRSKHPALIQNQDGQQFTYFALRSRFDAARAATGASFQFRDLRAKGATDLDDLAHAQKLLGHKRRATTEHYSGRRKGTLVEPVERDFVEENAGIVETGERALSKKLA